MNPLRTWRRYAQLMARVMVIVALFVGPPLALLCWFFHGYLGHGCTGTIVTEIASPSGTWKASVVDWWCESPLTTVITTSVQLVSTRDATRSADVLGVDTGGHDIERPRIAWTAPDVLQVTVPSNFYRVVQTLEYDGILIDLRIDPGRAEEPTK